MSTMNWTVRGSGLALLAFTISSSNAFSSIRTHNRRSDRSYGPKEAVITSSSSLQAYIFPGSEENGEVTYGKLGALFKDDDIPTPTISTPASTSFIEFINQQAAALARLAVAYSPKDRELNIKHINHVKLLGLGERHLEVEALVCDEESCVSLAVPVAFPKCCSDKMHLQDEYESCVIDNLGELNRYALETVNSILQREEEERRAIEEFKNQFGR